MVTLDDQIRQARERGGRDRVKALAEFPYRKYPVHPRMYR